VGNDVVEARIVVAPDPTDTDVTWEDVRKAIAAITKAAAPDARVHEVWKLSFDLTKNVALLKGLEGPDLSKVHSWMVGVAIAGHATVQSGASSIPHPTVVGRNAGEWVLTYAVWGFLGASIADSTRRLEREAAKVSDSIALTRGLALTSPQLLREVGTLDYESLDVHPFEGGYDVHVAQGRLLVRIENGF